MEWLKRKIRKWLNVREADDYVVGANCGCCGRWIEDHVVPAAWRWSLCDMCRKDK